MNSLHASDGRSPKLVATTWLATIAYLLSGIAAMWLLSPRVPYADQWGFYRHLIERPFPASIFAAENGHREVLPNLVRVAELHWMQADQNLQILVGLLCALATFGVLAWAIWRAPISAAARSAAIFAAALGVFWLGNERALAHSNDAVHAYPVTFFLVAALALVARASPRSESTRAWAAVACAIAATFSFGSGIASLPAITLVLLLRRAPLRAWIPVGIGLALALALYLFGQVDATTTTLRIYPLGQITLLLHWLSAPLLYVFWPLLDPEIAARLPAGVLRASADAVAQTWTAIFGDIRQSTAPQIVVGLIGVLAFTALGWRVWRESQPAAAAQRIALGVAGFALTVGAVIALSRSAYFGIHPGQIQAARYLVWSSLFWSGLLMTCLLRLKTPRTAGALAISIALIVAPSQIWMGQLALSMRTAAEQTALGGVVGVLGRDEPVGETVPEELAIALPLLARHDAAMYAWAETAWLGKQPASLLLHALETRDLQVTTIENRFDSEGMRIEFRLAETSQPRVLVLDESGMVIGIAQHLPSAGANAYRGWLRGNTTPESLQIAELR
jgi:uncharacterized membrane protein YuzA (DUF378 family)